MVSLQHLPLSNSLLVSYGIFQISPQDIMPLIPVTPPLSPDFHSLLTDNPFSSTASDQLLFRSSFLWSPQLSLLSCHKYASPHIPICFLKAHYHKQGLLCSLLFTPQIPKSIQRNHHFAKGWGRALGRPCSACGLPGAPPPSGRLFKLQLKTTGLFTSDYGWKAVLKLHEPNA